MASDPLADSAQDLIDALHKYLNDDAITQQFSPDFIGDIKLDLQTVTGVLSDYKSKLELSVSVSSPDGQKPSHRNRVNVYVAGAIAIPLSGVGGATYLSGAEVAAAVATRIGSSARGVATQGVRLAFWAAVVFFFTQLTDEHEMSVSANANSLRIGVSNLMRDLLVVDDLLTILEMTAAEIAAMTVDEIIDALTDAVAKGLAAIAVNKLIDELLRRFPGCTDAIAEFRAKYRVFHNLNANSSVNVRPATLGRKNVIKGEAKALLEAVFACVRAAIAGGTQKPT